MLMRMVQIMKGPAPLPAKKAGMRTETTRYLKGDTSGTLPLTCWLE